jgi:hypothetical protein
VVVTKLAASHTGISGPSGTESTEMQSAASSEVILVSSLRLPPALLALLISTKHTNGDLSPFFSFL